jgi:hypothetical protein
MKKGLLLIIAFWLASFSAWSQQPPVKSAGEKPIRSLAWLVGGVWTADASKLAPGLKIETRYQWSDNNVYLRFTTHFVTEKSSMNRYDGSFYWDPRTEQLTMWYMDSENTIYQGPVHIDGDVTSMIFRGEDFEGKMSELRVNVTRKSNDQYHWGLQERSGDTWKDLAGLDYVRVAGS